MQRKPYLYLCLSIFMIVCWDSPDDDPVHFGPGPDSNGFVVKNILK